MAPMNSTGVSRITNRVRGHPPASPAGVLGNQKGEKRSSIYSTLASDSIRVLHLSPGSYSDTLAGTLETVRLDESVNTYHAISYAWGPAIFPKELKLPQGTIRITESLHGALRRFRNPTAAVSLWVDAVCINQTDATERNKQVALMAGIFGNAEGVKVWLGEESEEETLAFWMISALNDVHVESSAVWSSWSRIADFFSAIYGKQPCQCPCCARPAGIYEDGWALFEATKSLVEILNRAYFERLWVVQEISRQSGEKVVFFCGRHKATKSSLDAAVTVLDQITSYYDGPPIPRPVKPGTPVFATFLHLHFCPTHLLLTLLGTRDLRCAEPRDRLYGVLAMTTDSDASELQPDYNMALDELWMRITAHILANPVESDQTRSGRKTPIDSSLVLAIAGLGNADDLPFPLPSWVPRYDALGREARNKQRFQERLCYQRSPKTQLAGGPRPFHGRRDSANPHLLRLRGKVFDKIISIDAASQCQGRHAPHLLGDEFWTFVNAILLPWYIRCKTFLADKAVHSGPRCDGFDQVIQQGAFIRHEKYHQSPSPREFREHCVESLPANSAAGLDWENAYSDLRPFLAWNVTHDYYLDRSRLLACTDTGRPCWVPQTARVGDKVCLFRGAAVPFVVHQECSDRFTLRGDAFVLGIMRGEAWPESEEEVEDIVLQ